MSDPVATKSSPDDKLKAKKSSRTQQDFPSGSGRELALEGIRLLLNNKHQEAEALFRDNKDAGVQLRLGYCFVAFMNALMTFEDEKINTALKILKESESKFAQEISSLQALKKMDEANKELRLEEQISIADCQVCMAILIFTNQDIVHYVKGGWILRKAWKIYDRTYREILGMYEKHFGTHKILPLSSALMRAENQSTSDLTNPDDWISSSHEVLPEISEKARKSIDKAEGSTIREDRRTSTSGQSSQRVQPSLPADTVARLLASVSFGYGTFQLCISLLPPNSLRLIHFLGFEGDREVGLEALMYARQGMDIRSPFATLGLLWYHSIVRPFFSLDGHNIVAGVGVAEMLLNESSKDYGSSALFLFFKGRVDRLKGNVELALNSYNTALKASNQREIQLICLHEVGWCHMLLFKWKEANKAFGRLKDESRWAKSFYSYVVSLTYGILDKTAESQKAMAEVPTLIRKKSNQLDGFVLKRAERMLKGTLTSEMMMMYCCELLYLWHSIPSCSVAILDKILAECDKVVSKKLFPLKCLLEGAVHNCKRNRDLAIQCFEESIARASDKEELHVLAFATYELSMLLLQHRETYDRGKVLLYRVKDDIKGYDFETRLHVRVHAAVKSLDKKSKA